MEKPSGQNKAETNASSDMQEGVFLPAVSLTNSPAKEKNKGNEEDKKNKRKRESLREVFWNGAIFKNPVLVGALGIYPILAACHTLRNALELSVLLAAMAIPAGLLLYCIGRFMPSWALPALAAGTAGVLYLPASALMENLFPGAINSLGIAAGLMTVNSMVLSRWGSYTPNCSFPAVLADTIGCSLGGTLVMCLCALFREWFVYGNIALRRASSPYNGRGAALPFFGFIILGFMAAFVQSINRRRAASSGRKKVNRL